MKKDKSNKESKKKLKKEKKDRQKIKKAKNKIRETYIGGKEKVKKIYKGARAQIKSSIRLEILFIVGVSLILSSVVGVTLKNMATSAGIGKESYINYEDSMQHLQNRLISAVQEITGVEQIQVSFNVDTDEIRRIISTKTVEEGAYQLQHQLGSMYIVETIENKNYGIYDFLGDEVPTSEYEKLYRELDNLLKEIKWEEKVAEEIVIKFFENQGLTSEQIKANIIESIVKGLDEKNYNLTETQTYIIDSQGNTFYEDSFVKRIDVVQAIQKSSREKRRYDSETITNIYPVIINDEIYYLFNESIPKGEIEYYYTDTSNALGWISGALLFVFLIFQFTKSKIRYIEYISECLGEISKGDLSYEVEIVGQDELAKVASDISYMEDQIRRQIEAQVQAEKIKNELITNVAHDLRTPLTSIIGYIGLVKEKKFESEEEYEKYLEIAYAKSEKLKMLIEDLFEYTKLNNQAVELKKQPMSITNLMNQLIEELMPIAEEKHVTLKTHINATDTTIYADIPKMTRVFENLIENAVKYTEIGEVIQVDIQEVGEEIYVSIRNRCKGLEKEDIDRLFDRFYRSDASRNSTTGGSGLGLAIAKNIVKLHGGEIWAQLNDNIISFNIRIKK